MSIASITESAHYITFKLGDELFAIPVAQVREVLDLTEITRVPTAPEYMRGVVNVRGSAIPVVDLRLKFGLPPAADSVNTRIVVLEMDLDGETTVVADSVHTVIELEPEDINEPPRLGMRWRSDLIRGMGRQDDHFIILLDIAKVFASDSALLAESIDSAAEAAAL